MRITPPVGSSGSIIALGNTSGATPIDLRLGDLATLTVTGNTTLSLTNTPELGEYQVLRLRVTNGGAFTLTLPTINWAGGAAPTWLAAGIELAVLTVMNIGGSVVIDGAYVGQVV